MKSSLLKYLKNNKHYWWTVGALPGVYAISYLYTKNYTLVNSWTQFIGLVIGLILVPSVIMIVLHYIIKGKNERIKNWLYSSAIIIITSITLSLVIYLGWRWKALVLVAIIALITSWFAGKHYKKGILLLGFMTVISLFQFALFYWENVHTRETWVKKSDLSSLEFVKKPNIYFIQPDGYASKTALENKHYRYDNNLFYAELEPRGFEFNHNYRSNYPSTLSSNAALFNAQHHFYDNGKFQNELFNARQQIMGENTVLRTLKNNGYQLTAILQHRYLLLNHPDVAYDHINITESELSILPDYHLNKDYVNNLKEAISKATDDPQFYFIEILEPGHITGLESSDSTIKEERDKYIEGLNNVSLKLLYIIDHISKTDPTAIVIMAADHGGFVGYNYTGESYEKVTKDVTLQQGIFGALFAVKAPSDFTTYQKEIKSSVSVFPQLFNYLSNKPVVKQGIDNSSYQLIKNGKQPGVYRYYNENGVSVTEKIL